MGCGGGRKIEWLCPHAHNTLTDGCDVGYGDVIHMSGIHLFYSDVSLFIGAIVCREEDVHLVVKAIIVMNVGPNTQGKGLLFNFKYKVIIASGGNHWLSWCSWKDKLLGYLVTIQQGRGCKWSIMLETENNK